MFDHRVRRFLPVLGLSLVLGLAVGHWLASRSAKEKGTSVDAHDASAALRPRLPARRSPRAVPAAASAEAARPDGAIDGERVLRFRDDEALRSALASLPGGTRVLGSIKGLHLLRLGVSDSAAFKAWRDGLGDAADEGWNFPVSIPPVPSGDLASSGSQVLNRGRELLGIDAKARATGAGVTVAILDTGVGGEWQGTGKPAPANPHGTYVAGIVASQDSLAPGLAPGVRLLDVPVLDSSGTGDTFTVAQGIVQAVDAGARVLNLSLGSYGDSLALRDAVAYAQSQGAVVVAAAGNDGLQKMAYPAAYDGVVAVMATDADGRMALFSNRGSENAWLVPGVGVAVADDGDYALFSGTSASAPMMSAAIALVASGLEGGSVQEAVALLKAYADDAGAVGADATYGLGYPDVSRVLARDTQGVVDLAVGSLLPAVDESGAATGFWLANVQNRGTTPIPAPVVVIKDKDGAETVHALPRLEAGASTLVTINGGAGRDPVRATAKIAADSHPANDARGAGPYPESPKPAQE